MDLLSIRDLRIPCIVGVYPSERKREQDLFLDVDMWFDFKAAANSDHLSDTLDYTRVAEALTEFIRAERFQLIEALAYRACEKLFELDPRLERCGITLRKPQSVPNAMHASVVVIKDRPQ